MTKTHIIVVIIVLFIGVISGVLYVSYLFANRATQKSMTPPSQTAALVQPTTQQIKKITFKNTATGETIELWADGTINYYDKNGKLKKTARRGFAETISKFRDLEKLINENKKISGLDGFIIIIETEQGTIVVNPGDDGDGNSVVDDIYDYIDTTLNPTPRPTVRPVSTPIPTSRPTPLITATPQPFASPSPQSTAPFNCSDYYKSGKSIKISNIICGDQ